jgi:RNA polymerase sigma factor (sigma-70 family)
MDNLTQIYQQCIKGDSKAQEQLYLHLAPKMLGVCYRYTHNIMEAEDVLQDAFIRVFKFLHTYKGEGDLEAWVRRIMVNTALNHIKKNKRIAEELEIEKATVVESTLTVDLNNYDTSLIMNALQQLPDGYKVILNLFAIEGYSHKEIAEQFNIAESTSRSQFLRAKVALKKILEEQDEFELKH